MERSSFFNAMIDQNGTPDRSYLAEDFARYFATFIGNGVFPNPSTNLQVMAIDNNMQIRIKAGFAWINGYMYENTDDYIFKLDPADGVLNRIDRIALRLDFLERKIKAVVKKGTFASSAIAPSLQRDTDAYEIALADIKINKGVIKITQTDITDLRLNKDLCGIVHGTVEQVDVTTLFNQYTEGFKLKEQGFETDFNTWFNGIKNTLGEDVAGNLLNLINAHKDDKNNPHGVTAAQVGAVSQTDFNSHLADYTKQVPYAVATGTANTYAVTLNPVPAAYTEGMALSVKINVASTGASTINVNGLGAKGIKKANGTDITNLKANGIYTLRYDGTNFILQGEGGEYGTATPGEVLAGYTVGTEEGVKNGTATIESLGGKKCAHGKTLNSYNCDVSGLSFAPTVVKVESVDRSKRHVFHRALGDLAGDDVGNCNSSGTVGFLTGYIKWKSDGFTAYMYATVDTNWYAYE